jgi:hypothetical protein
MNAAAEFTIPSRLCLQENIYCFYQFLFFPPKHIVWEKQEFLAILCMHVCVCVCVYIYTHTHTQTDGWIYRDTVHCTWIILWFFGCFWTKQIMSKEVPLITTTLIQFLGRVNCIDVRNVAYLRRVHAFLWFMYRFVLWQRWVVANGSRKLWLEWFCLSKGHWCQQAVTHTRAQSLVCEWNDWNTCKHYHRKDMDIGEEEKRPRDKQTDKQTPWPESSSELYRPRNHRLSVKLVPTLMDRGCCMVNTMVDQRTQTTNTSLSTQNFHWICTAYPTVSA